MFWRIGLTILANVLGGLGYLFLYLTDKQKLKKYKMWLLAGLILTTVTIWGDFAREIRESKSKAREFAATDSNFSELKRQYETISGQYELLSEERNSLAAKFSDESDSLKARFSEVENSNRRLTELLEPFVNRARLRFPGWSDQEALQKLASEISKMQPKLVFLGRTEPLRDSISNLFHTIYVFRSQPTGALRDVQIKIRFDGRFVSITGRRTGAIGIGREQMTPDQDSAGFYYTTGYLHEENDIKIEVISKEPLDTLSMNLSPQ
ncbi:MAG: hypothetical protein WBF13_14245 [Candidatus Zixiibacteriota bacterium]